MSLARFENATGVSRSNLETYTDRLYNALRSLAPMVGRDHSEVFSHWYDHWSELVELEGEVAPMERTHREVARALPCFAELVLTLRDGAQSVGWMSCGRSGAHLAETVSSLLHGTLSAHLRIGGDRARAEILAQLFAAAFPDLNRLRDMSATAQAFLMGVAPRAEGYALKTYLNPRLSSAEPHTHLRAMASAVGADLDAFDQLLASAYPDRGKTSHLYGLGVDLVAEEPARLKLYVRIDRPRAAAFLTTLTGGAHALLAELLERFEHPALSDSVELALAWVEGAQSIKLTRFWAGKQMTLQQEREVLDWIEPSGFPRHGVDRALASLRAPAKSELQRSPLHAIGLEIGRDGAAKLNAYLQPEL